MNEQAEGIVEQLSDDPFEFVEIKKKVDGYVDELDCEPFTENYEARFKLYQQQMQVFVKKLKEKHSDMPDEEFKEMAAKRIYLRLGQVYAQELHFDPTKENLKVVIEMFCRMGGIEEFVQ